MWNLCFLVLDVGLAAFYIIVYLDRPNEMWLFFAVLFALLSVAQFFIVAKRITRP